MCLTPDIHVFGIPTTFRCFSEMAPAQPGSLGRGIKLAAAFIDPSVTKKLARMLGDFQAISEGLPLICRLLHVRAGVEPSHLIWTTRP